MRRFSRILRGLIPLFLLTIGLTLPIQRIHAESALTEEGRARFQQHLTGVAEQFIGISYEFGGDPDISGTADNSHLMCTIFEEAARVSGLRFRGYMPMNRLLAESSPIAASKIDNGDLMVLENGHAALIYRLENPERFHLLYASLKRKQVISFSTENVVFDAYWLLNLKGYYRLNPGLFAVAD